MSGGNGADLGTVIAMLGQVLQTQQEHGRLLGEQGRMIAEHGRRLDAIERRLTAIEGDVRALRQTVTEYHSSVIGHGILISERDARLRRVEEHLNLPSIA